MRGVNVTSNREARAEDDDTASAAHHPHRGEASTLPARPAGEVPRIPDESNIPKEDHMASGGHAHSGPLPNPNSLRSDRRGLRFRQLTPYEGTAPAFPLPGVTSRELEHWNRAWTTPQASAWAEEEWRWQSVGLWVRLSVRCEDHDAGAALFAQLMRLSDEIGMSTSGLARNRWTIAPTSTAEVLPIRPTTRDRPPIRRLRPEGWSPSIERARQAKRKAKPDEVGPVES